MSDAFLSRLSEICLALPEAEAYVMHGHPSFRAGKKPYVIAGAKEGGWTMSVKVDKMAQPVFLEDPRFHKTHYIGQHGWVTLTVTGEPDWEEIRHLVALSYRGIANARMLKALAAQA